MICQTGSTTDELRRRAAARRSAPDATCASPTDAPTPHTARIVKQVFREQAAGGTSIFLSTHVLSIAEDFCDRIGIMMRGKIVALGGIDDLRRDAQVDGRLEDIFFKVTEGAHE